MWWREARLDSLCQRAERFVQQHAGRLQREHACKVDVRIVDFLDTGHPALLRMWDKRQRGFVRLVQRRAQACIHGRTRKKTR